MQISSRLLASTLGVGMLLSLFSATAQAQVLLTPGSTVAPVPVVGFLGGTQVGTSTTGFFATGAAGNVISGTLISSVFQTGGAGSTLDFYYQLISNGQSTTTITSLNVVSFAGLNTSVAQSSTDTDGAGPMQTPSGTSLIGNAFRSGDGEGVQFTFSDAIDPSSNSQIAVVRTNAVTFSLSGSAGILGNGVGTTTVATVAAPVAANVAPEPGTVALVSMGLMGTAGMVIRRRK